MLSGVPATDKSARTELRRQKGVYSFADGTDRMRPQPVQLFSREDK